VSKRNVTARIRAIRRIIDVLSVNLGTELVDGIPDGLNLKEPPADAYYAMSSEGSLSEHKTNHPVAVYVYPFEELDVVAAQATGGPLTRFVRYERDIAITVRMAQDSGAQPFVESWKTPRATERDSLRLSYYLGAVGDVMWKHARNGEDITLIRESRIDEDLDLSTVADAPELWGRTVWEIVQRVLVPQNNS